MRRVLCAIAAVLLPAVALAQTVIITGTVSDPVGSQPFSVPVTVSGAAAAITIGLTSIGPVPDSGNANLLVAQPAVLTQPATIQSMSFYVSTAAGKLRLGVYDAAGNKVAETVEITPVANTWNTANVLAQVALPAGTYWLAYLASDGALGFANASGPGAKWYGFPYGALPSTLATTGLGGGGVQWSLYATLTATAPPPPPPPPPPGMFTLGVSVNPPGAGTVTISPGPAACTATPLNSNPCPFGLGP